MSYKNLTNDDLLRAKKSSFGLEPIRDFGTWYADILSGIAKADSEPKISAALDKIRPYAAALWIAPERLPVALDLARKRRSEWPSTKRFAAGDI